MVLRIEELGGSSGATSLPTENLVFNKEYTGPLVVDRATVLADMSASSIRNLDVFVVEAPTGADTVALTFGGSTIPLPVGAGQTFTADVDDYLADFSVTLDAGEKIFISTVGLA